jgi:HTH-type transcriptional regulator/antitoxin HigA
MKTMNKANPFANGIPKTYRELCKRYLPRKIHDDAEDQEATAIVDALAGHDLNEDQEDYLDLVSDLVDEYDRATRRQPKEASPIDVLKLLLEQHKVSARELSRILGKDESLGSLILTGRRSITVEHSKMLGEHFNVKPSVFLGLE